MTRVAVVGAGLAGLSAAWEVARAGLDVTVLESERRAGGVVLTERRDGFIVEAGPDGWLAADPDIAGLAEALGIADRIVPQAARGASHWTGTVLEPLPDGGAAALLGIDATPDHLAAGFQSFAGGMGELVAALAGAAGGSIRFPLGVSALTPAGTAWHLPVAGGATVHADAVVLAIPAYAAGRLLEQAGVAGARRLGDVPYLPSVTVSLAYPAEQVGRALEGTGFVSTASGHLRACTYASLKFPGRAPERHVLLRAFVTEADEDPTALAHDALSPILGLRGPPLWGRVFRWARGIPRYGAHHAADVAAVRSRLTRLAPLTICGAGYDGAGVSACVRSGRAAGRAILERLL